MSVNSRSWIQTSVDQFPFGVPSAGNVLRNSAIRCWFQLERKSWVGFKSYSVTVTPEKIIDFSKRPEPGQHQTIWWTDAYIDELPIPPNYFSVVVLDTDRKVLARDLVPYNKISMWGDESVYAIMKRGVVAMTPDM